ncbi:MULTISPECIES: dihydroorotase [Leuconostoc gelidum group]|uniref:Dihydroorotase n=1 Tax=Leuconostoc gelidum subsp. gelidum TaxID=1607839 RepID=A0ABS7V4Q1_LEUGE|nr:MULTISPECIES: dihydroorotase [Leuconostoc gelidum group]AFS40299.1 dihydroorotase [Leuconostoc gelidum JB7]MBZ5960905.1 dihydroorotase [Leuconostoc gasicomitatum]MBZ5963475.1 dihydroorotase [Leuconostoc gelidum subsp. gelidum]MBZ5975683.1 dihydroorotase [Leuconostoc gelidum subsp. gelidum]MBZ5976149.1 dihydroorotase [Leuconostoc gelidum subsp. gelidum]
MQLIKNAKILEDSHLVTRDVLIDGKKIVKVSENCHLEVDTIDAKGAFLSSGLVDVHVHFREPGFDYKETIATGSQAAARGGFTTVIAMPNLNPVPDTAERIAAQIKLNEINGTVHVKQYGAVSADLTASKVSDISGMAAAGAVAFSNDGKGVQTADTMLQAMLAAAKADKPLAAHLEDDSLLHGGVMNAGKQSEKLEIPGITGLAESSQLARDLMLAKATGVHYHVAHISTKESVALVRIAKLQGVNVTAEVSPHHLLLSDMDIKGDNALFKMNPPLRSQADRQAVLAGLLDGTIDMIATDHAPHGTAEKNKPFREAPFGITGIETSFQLLYTHLVRSGVMTLETLLQRMISAPIASFKLEAPTEIKPGETADLALFDLEHQKTISVDNFKSKGKNTPFMGWQVYGNTLATWVDGQLVYQSF